MRNEGLDRFIAQTRAAWGPLTSELVETVGAGLRRLAASPVAEPWLEQLRAERPANRTLHQDADLGFVLFAHAEDGGLYRPPHDHGRSWVVYGVLDGEIEMRTYCRVEDGAAGARLVKRGSTILRPGQVQTYLPGDIHDTRCVTAGALLLRFTERDLKGDVSHPVTRYRQGEGGWTPAAAA